MTTIYEALAEVMRTVKPVAKKERNTAPGANYNFRGIDAVTNAVGPALRKHGVIVVPEVLDYQYGTVTVGKNRTEMSHARLTIAFTWFGPEGDSIRSVTAGEAFDSGDKATSKAHSVAFRTAMLQTLCLPTDEADPDTGQHVRSGADPLIVAANQVKALAAAKSMTDQELFDDFTLWSQGKSIKSATAGELEQYAKTLGGEQ